MCVAWDTACGRMLVNSCDHNDPSHLDPHGWGRTSELTLLLNPLPTEDDLSQCFPNLAVDQNHPGSFEKTQLSRQRCGCSNPDLWTGLRKSVHLKCWSSLHFHSGVRKDVALRRCCDASAPQKVIHDRKSFLNRVRTPEKSEGREWTTEQRELASKELAPPAAPFMPGGNISAGGAREGDVILAFQLFSLDNIVQQVGRECWWDCVSGV